MNELTKTPRIWHDRSEDVVEVFPQYSELFSEKQLQHPWRASEIKVEKDKHEILVVLSEAQRHSVITALSLFTKYEIFAGKDFWGDRFNQIVKGPEFIRLAAVNSMVELAIHKPFYQKINQVLGLDTNEFYNAYVDRPELKKRVEFIDSLINHENDLVALGGFSFVEGGILYSTFALLKSFQANGMQSLKTIVSGINYTLAEEGLHCIAAATVYRHLEKETLEDNVYESRYGKQEDVQQTLYSLAKVVYEHEAAIIDMLFEKGELHITKQEFLCFVGVRLNACLVNLGLKPIFSEEGDTISSWFYKNITSFVMHDFFNSLGSQYTGTWNEDDFCMDVCEEEEAKDYHKDDEPSLVDEYDNYEYYYDDNLDPPVEAW